MSPVKGQARSPGRILFSVYMGSLSPVDQDRPVKFKKPKDGT